MSDINELKEKVEAILRRVEESSDNPICLTYIERAREELKRDKPDFIYNLKNPKEHTACGFSSVETRTIEDWVNLNNKIVQAGVPATVKVFPEDNSS